MAGGLTIQIVFTTASDPVRAGLLAVSGARQAISPESPFMTSGQLVNQLELLM